MKVISVTPAGRARYINILANYILKNRDKIDEHHFWINTDVQEDILAIEKWCKNHPDFFKAIMPKFPPPRTAKTIHHFYKDYCEEDRVYLRFDDDICWMADDCVAELIKFRMENKDLFLAYANVINHTTCNRFHSRKIKFPVLDYYFNGSHAKIIHHAFINRLRRNELSDYLFEDWIVEKNERVSTNVISWFGSHLKEINGNVVGNEEQFLAVDYPKMSGKKNGICGSALACHFAYAPQRNYLEKTNLLSLYEKYSVNNNIKKFFV
jgi:hypothetical protein